MARKEEIILSIIERLEVLANYDEAMLINKNKLIMQSAMDLSSLISNQGHISAIEALKEIIEIYANMEGFIPEAAPEDYQQRIIEQMYECARGGIYTK